MDSGTLAWWATSNDLNYYVPAYTHRDVAPDERCRSHKSQLNSLDASLADDQHNRQAVESQQDGSVGDLHPHTRLCRIGSCGERFSLLKKLRLHYQTRHQVCLWCFNLQFDDPDRLRNHINSAHEKCDHCSDYFKGKQQKENHMKGFHRCNIPNCLDANTEFVSKEAAREHGKRNHYTCPLCFSNPAEAGIKPRSNEALTTTNDKIFWKTAESCLGHILTHFKPYYNENSYPASHKSRTVCMQRFSRSVDKMRHEPECGRECQADDKYVLQELKRLEKLLTDPKLKTYSVTEFYVACTKIVMVPARENGVERLVKKYDVYDKTNNLHRDPHYKTPSEAERREDHIRSLFSDINSHYGREGRFILRKLLDQADASDWAPTHGPNSQSIQTSYQSQPLQYSEQSVAPHLTTGCGDNAQGYSLPQSTLQHEQPNFGQQFYPSERGADSIRTSTLYAAHSRISSTPEGHHPHTAYKNVHNTGHYTPSLPLAGGGSVNISELRYMGGGTGQVPIGQPITMEPNPGSRTTVSQKE